MIGFLGAMFIFALPLIGHAVDQSRINYFPLLRKESSPCLSYVAWRSLCLCL